VLVVFVAQSEIHSQVAANPPVVLREDMEPVGASVLVATPASAGGCRRVAEQEIGKGIASELTGVGERAAGVIGLLRPELQMKVVAAELDPMRTAVEQHVLVQLKVLIVSIGERRGIAEDAVETTRRNLRIAHITRIVRHALKPDLAREVHASVLADLSACHAQPAESKLVQEPARDTRVADDGVSGLRVERATEAGHERFL
jgi:hypothetical protein